MPDVFSRISLAARQADSVFPGEIALETIWGRTLEALLVLLRYSLIVVPVAMVAFEVGRLNRRTRKATPPHFCEACGSREQRQDAIFCDRCGAALAKTAAGKPGQL